MLRYVGTLMARGGGICLIFLSVGRLLFQWEAINYSNATQMIFYVDMTISVIIAVVIIVLGTVAVKREGWWWGLVVILLALIGMIFTGSLYMIPFWALALLGGIFSMLKPKGDSS